MGAVTPSSVMLSPLLLVLHLQSLISSAVSATLNISKLQRQEILNISFIPYWETSFLVHSMNLLLDDLLLTHSNLRSLPPYC